MVHHKNHNPMVVLTMKKIRGMLFFCLFVLFFFQLCSVVLVLSCVSMGPLQVYTCSPCWALLPPPSPCRPSGSSRCTSPKHPVSFIEPGLAFHIIYETRDAFQNAGLIFVKTAKVMKTRRGREICHRPENTEKI